MDAHGYSIGDAAKASGLSVKTIRYYEQIGLIAEAERHDTSVRTGGNRVFTEADIGRLRFIHHARMLDLSLDDIRQLLTIADEDGCPGDRPEYRRVFSQHLDEIDERIAHLRGLREQIEALMSQERKPERDACTWNTCDCMQSDAISKAPAEKQSSKSRK